MTKQYAARSLDSGIYWDEEKREHDLEMFFNDFQQAMLSAPLDLKLTVMREFGIWFGPQR